MKNKLNVALVCTPWCNYRRPSIQFGSLKSFAKKRLNGVNIDVLNFHLKISNSIDFETYNKIGEQNIFFIESFYANFLYPELDLFKEYPDLKEIFKTENEMKCFLKKLKDSQEKVFEQTDWPKYKIIGFTSGFGQLLSSLYLIKKIKGENPDIKILIGGTNVCGEKGKSLMEQFKEIDLAISGEGELNFYHILKSEIEGDENYKKLKGIIYREGEGVVFNRGLNQLKDINDLEFPDYSDYFRDLRELKNYDSIKKFVSLPIEFSRGCFHDKCPFCSLNRFWKYYRMKKISRIFEEIKYFNKNYGVNNFIFCDNIFPEIKLRELFEGIKKLNKNLNRKIMVTSMEAKTSLNPSIFKLISESGIIALCLGIETFSSSLLKKMNKPSNLMYNVQSMKMCELYGIHFLYNFLYNYPLTTEDEIEENLKNIELIKHLKPPTWIRILRLQIHSDIYNNPEKYGIKILGNEYNYKYLFPPEFRNNLNLDFKMYEIEEKVCWEGVIEKVKKWRGDYYLLKSESKFPILYHFKKDNKTIIVRRSVAEEEIYELEEESEIYDFCEISKTFEEIKNKFGVDEENLKEIINGLKNKKLLFESDNKYLSLSIDLKKYIQNKSYEVRFSKKITSK